MDHSKKTQPSSEATSLAPLQELEHPCRFWRHSQGISLNEEGTMATNTEDERGYVQSQDALKKLSKAGIDYLKLKVIRTSDYFMFVGMAR